MLQLCTPNTVATAVRIVVIKIDNQEIIADSLGYYNGPDDKSDYDLDAL